MEPSDGRLAQLYKPGGHRASLGWYEDLQEGSSTDLFLSDKLYPAPI